MTGNPEHSTRRFEGKVTELIDWEIRLEEAEKNYRISLEKGLFYFPNMPDPYSKPLLDQIERIKIAIRQVKSSITYQELHAAAICTIKAKNLNASTEQVMAEIQKDFGLDVVPRNQPAAELPADSSDPAQEPVADPVDPADKITPEVLQLLQSVKPEAEKIYNAIRRIGFSGRNADACPEWKQAALDMFSRDQDGYELIKRDYLEDDKLYNLNAGHERRDFIGQLLKVIVKDQNGETIGGQTLYCEYMSLANTA